MYKKSGKIIYTCLLPLIRRLIKNTKRAYVILENEGSVLVVRNWLGRQKWEAAGGGLKKLETPKLAARRELKEELGIGLSASSLALLSRGRWASDMLGFEYWIFHVNCKTKPELKIQTKEVLEAKWMSLSKLDRFDISKEIKDALRTLEQK